MRALCILALSACTSTSPPPPHPAQNKPPSAPCLLAVDDALARLSAPDEALTHADLDLDGDGLLDPIVTHPSSCGSGGCTWELYLSHGTCARHVGELFGVKPRQLPHVHDGLVEIAIDQRDGCAGMARVEVRAWFDGASYVAHEMRTCDCPERPDASSAPDANCEEWHLPTDAKSSAN